MAPSFTLGALQTTLSSSPGRATPAPSQRKPAGPLAERMARSTQPAFTKNDSVKLACDYPNESQIRHRAVGVAVAANEDTAAAAEAEDADKTEAALAADAVDAVYFVYTCSIVETTFDSPAHCTSVTPAIRKMEEVAQLYTYPTAVSVEVKAGSEDVVVIDGKSV
ncbi:Hypothetical protein D9617_30g011510 [Elsinoe fawcettii]|nr:Hypothetical protein D9617_30g011510 [Elsinoe fawcettii]